MGSELESTGNDSISSNNWILVGQFRNMETKMRQSFLLICSKFTKQIRIVLTVLCGVQGWTHDLMLIRSVLLLHMCLFRVCTSVPTYVYMWVWIPAFLCEFPIDSQRHLGVLFLRSRLLCFQRQSFSRSWGLQIILDQLAGLPVSPRDLPVCLPSTVVTWACHHAWLFLWVLGMELGFSVLWGQHLTLFKSHPSFYFQRNFFANCVK